MNPDILVGAVTIALGAFTMSAALFNWEWYYQRRRSLWLQSLLGRPGTRLFYGVLGMVLIVLGGAIAMGFVANRESSDRSAPEPKTNERFLIASGST